MNKQIRDLEAKLDDGNKLQREISIQFKQSSVIQEEALIRRSKELTAVLKEKKCRDCIICQEDLKNLKGE